MLFFNGSDFSATPRQNADSRLREDFNIEGTATGRTYAPASDSPASRAILTREKIDAFTRLVTDQSDLNFILSILEHTVAQEKMRKEQPL